MFEVDCAARRECEPIAVRLHEPEERQQLDVREILVMPCEHRHRHVSPHCQTEKLQLGMRERVGHRHMLRAPCADAACGLGGFSPF